MKLLKLLFLGLALAAANAMADSAFLERGGIPGQGGGP